MSAEGKPRPRRRKPARPEPGSPGHEKVVKKALESNIKNSVKLLEDLDIVEAREIDIGNSFLAFRFKVAKGEQ